MATYYHVGSEIQGEGLQTLYLMNPGYMGYSETAASPAGTNMVLMNSGGNSLNPGGLGHAHQQNQHLVGIPLQSTASTPVLPPSQNPSAHGFVPRHYYNYWTSPSADPAAGGASHHPIQNMPQMESELGVRRGHPVQQGLSLSLSPQRPAYPTYRPEPEIPSSSGAISPGCGGEDARISSNSWSNSAVSTGINGIHSVLMGSKYLKAAQQLLDEVVNVGKGIKDGKLKNLKGNKEQSMENSGGEMNGKRSAELTTAERQELQMKKAKLVNMLDEVEQRYRQYHHQMQIIVSTFEAAAGLGSARTYTALALQTISKQFRCLRDAISGQIRAASRSLGEDESLGGSSRLKLVDHQMRQQRALQQLGMIQHNAWRPQRGLPERSVSVLRAWLFEHFLHPYPKDSDKIMLAKQTGLTRNQVSNWFINARVRLWKPMVEEMYMQETKEQEQNGAHDKASKIETNEDSASKSAATQENSPIRMEQINNLNSIPEMTNEPKAPPLPSAITSSPSLSPAATTLGTALRNHSSFRLVGSSDSQASFHEGEQMLQINPKKPKYQNANTIPLMSNVDMKHNETDQQELFFEQQTRNGYSLLRDTTTGGGFGGYQIGDMARFNLEQFAPRFTGNNGVSLTLGLPDCDNLSLSGTQQTYLSNQNFQMGRRLEMGGEANDFCNMNSPSATHSSNAYDSLNIQDRKQYAAQLLPDFVA